MAEEVSEFTVVSWNILLDTTGAWKHVRPQHERQDDCTRVLLDLKRQLDVVALYEVEDAIDHGNLGKKIAQQTIQTSGIWTPHSREREQIGMFGERVHSVEFIDLGNNRSAALTRIGNTAIMGVHINYGVSPQAHMARVAQTRVALDALKDDEQAIIMGDFNCFTWQKPRKLIESHGFRSVFDILGQPHQPTVPTHEYRAMLSWWQRLGVGAGFAIDDIYVKGLQVQDAGLFEGKSDHLGVWATVTPDL